MSFGNSRSPAIAEVMKMAMNDALADVHTCMPGKVEKYDSVLQKADVKPLLKRALIQDTDSGEPSDEVETLPVIPEVPVIFPRGGGFFQSLPLAKGDFVLLVVCERSIDNYMYGAGIDTDPVDLRQFDLTDAVAITGFSPFSRSIKGALGLSSNMVIGKERGPQINITSSCVEVTSNGLSASTGGYVALAQKVDLLWTTLYTLLTTWVPAPPDGGAAFKAASIAAFPTPPTSVACSNLKADL